jgi:hypothetical protein
MAERYARCGSGVAIDDHPFGDKCYFVFRPANSVSNFLGVSAVQLNEFQTVTIAIITVLFMVSIVRSALAHKFDRHIVLQIAIMLAVVAVVVEPVHILQTIMKILNQVFSKI